MCWTQVGAHLALQARTRVLNGELEDIFRRRWPGFQPLSKAEPDKAENSTFAVLPPPPVTRPAAHGFRWAPHIQEDNGDASALLCLIARDMEREREADRSDNRIMEMWAGVMRCPASLVLAEPYAV